MRMLQYHGGLGAVACLNTQFVQVLSQDATPNGSCNGVCPGCRSHRSSWQGNVSNQKPWEILWGLQVVGY